MSPFETLYAYKVNLPILVDIYEASNHNAKEETERMQALLLQQCKSNLKVAQEKMK